MAKNTSITQLSVKLFNYLFEEKEWINEQNNLTGKGSKGGSRKEALDRKRVKQIKKIIYKQERGTSDYKKNVWKDCVTAIHKHIS